jgi:hypothetical protein
MTPYTSLMLLQGPGQQQGNNTNASKLFEDLVDQLVLETGPRLSFPRVFTMLSVGGHAHICQVTLCKVLFVSAAEVSVPYLSGQGQAIC